MAILFGVANNAPEYVIEKLLKSGIKSNEIGLIPHNSRAAAKPSYKLVLVLTYSDFARNLPVFKSEAYRNTQIILFASAMRIAEYTGMTFLDFDRDKEHPEYGFNFKPLNLRALRTQKPAEIVRTKGKYLSKIIKHVKEGSLLNPLMTFIYTLPSVAQTEVKIAVAKWLVESRKDPELAKLLSNLKTTTVTERVKNKLSDILMTDLGVAYRKAFAEYRTQKKAGDVKFPRIAKDFGVAEYEMKYLLSVMEDSKHTLYADSFDKARNRTV